MDTLDFRLTDVPQNLTEALNLTEGENVVLQNIDKTAVGFFRESAAVPSSSAKAFQVPPGGSYQIQAGPTPVWAWTTDSAGCQLVFNLVR